MSEPSDEGTGPAPDPLDARQLASLRQLVALAGEDRLALLVEMFGRRSVELAEELAARPDAAAVQRSAHELAGSAGTIGAVVVAGLARGIEVRARAGGVPEPGEVARLQAEIERARAALAAVVADG